MSNIQVVCRFRPSNSTTEKNYEDCINIKDDTTCTTTNNTASQFTFDHIFGQKSSQIDVFDKVAKPIVEDLFKGYNGTIFVYGQTGSGKTHTMMGGDGEHCGITPRIVKQVFDTVEKSDESLMFEIGVQYVEIYMEKLKDLLDTTRTNLSIKDDQASGRGIYVEGASEEFVTTTEEVLQLIGQGMQNRVTSSTRMNAESSRSHSIFVITVSQRHIVTKSSKSGKLFLVDLAGSEKVKKTGASGRLLDEAKTINKSLTTLGMVINALTDGKSTHIPYRDSKLTRLLQDSLGGNSRTTLIVNCSPSSYNEEETLSTLRFGLRAKTIKNKPKVNQELSAKELGKLLEQAKTRILLLETELKKKGQTIIETPSTDAIQELQIKMENVVEKNSRMIEDIELLKDEVDSLTKALETQKTVAEENQVESQALREKNHEMTKELTSTREELLKYKALTEKYEVKDKSAQGSRRNSIFMKVESASEKILLERIQKLEHEQVEERKKHEEEIEKRVDAIYDLESALNKTKEAMNELSLSDTQEEINKLHLLVKNQDIKLKQREATFLEYVEKTTATAIEQMNKIQELERYITKMKIDMKDVNGNLRITVDDPSNSVRRVVRPLRGGSKFVPRPSPPASPAKVPSPSQLKFSFNLSKLFKGTTSTSEAPDPFGEEELD